MIKKIGLIALSVFVFGFGADAAMAQTKYDGFTELNADGLPVSVSGTYTWAEVEADNSSYMSACKSMNTMMGAGIPCKIDHASFQAFYKGELSRPNKEDRVSSNPGQFCGTSGLNFFSEWSAITQNDFLVCANDAACKADFLSKVKAVNCVISNSDAEPSVTLDAAGTMTFNITRKANGDTPNGDGWVKAEAFKLFPLYAKLRGH